MAVNLVEPTTLLPVPGVQLGALAAGLKSNGARDLVIVALSEGSSAAAVFTDNAYCAAPVTVAREHMASNQGYVRALLVNSGGANAATGEQGMLNARENCSQLANLLDVDASSVLSFSTGVIGEQLPMPLMRAGIDKLAGKLGTSSAHWLDAAHGILTTDTKVKAVSRTVEIEGEKVTITGFAKGSGMIQPNMATMLAYIFTDAKVAPDVLGTILKASVDDSFNLVSVDGDTSTNDACVLVATARTGPQLSPSHHQWGEFADTLHAVSLQLAQALVRDGEGATKFITIEVSGGQSRQDCRQVGLTVANSPLVKTAFFASDANLGRIIMAVGRSGAAGLDINRLSLKLDEVSVLVNGQPAADYTEEKGSAVMQRDEITVAVDLGAGDASLTFWTCDLSHEYVSINADYRS